jgi:hypothetical protein
MARAMTTMRLALPVIRAGTAPARRDRGGLTPLDHPIDYRVGRGVPLHGSRGFAHLRGGNWPRAWSLDQTIDTSRPNVTPPRAMTAPSATNP